MRDDVVNHIGHLVVEEGDGFRTERAEISVWSSRLG
jgi:hypothetical protein